MNFQTALVGCFYKERIINKEELNYVYCTYNKILRQIIFHLGTKYLYEKYCPSYAEIFPWTSGISPSWTEWETSRSHINVIKNLWRNGSILLILFIVASCLLSHPDSQINSPLDWSSKPVFQRLIHLKDSDNLKQYQTAIWNIKKPIFKFKFRFNINKNNIKFKLQKVLKLKLSFKKIPYSFLQTTRRSYWISKQRLCQFVLSKLIVSQIR